jgi:hypothetical protein
MILRLFFYILDNIFYFSAVMNKFFFSKKSMQHVTVLGRQMPHNYDGSSCFMDSLLCALFFPSKLRVIDPYLLLGKRVDTNISTFKELCQVLRVTAKCIRGVMRGTDETYRAVRPLLAHYLLQITGINFEMGQHDPVDLYEALLRALDVGGVFTTKKTIESHYTNHKQSTVATTDQMFRFSVHHAVSEGKTKFEALFPCVETLVVNTEATSTEEDVLCRQRTIVEFAGGPVVVFTREVLDPSLQRVQYGRWSPSTKSFVLPILNTVNKKVQWYELQAVLCWKGHLAVGGESGHYVCFVFDDAERQWYFFNDANGRNQGLERVQDLERHPMYPPSETGMMFIYALVVSPPTDI